MSSRSITRSRGKRASASKRKSYAHKQKPNGPPELGSPSQLHLKTTLPQESPGSLFSSPSTISTSFGSQFNRELAAFMDKMDTSADSRLALCSTPATGPAPSGANPSAYRSSSLFSELSPTPEKKPRTCSASHMTPITSLCSSGSILRTPSHSSHLRLSQWGLPEKVLQCYSKRGVTTMFEWQAECLSQPGVLDGCNLIYAAPTSAGKTLVAELLSLKCVLEQRKKVVLILPFVSIAQEKTVYLKEIFVPVGVKVGGFMGNQSAPGGFAAVDIAVCTIERANSMVNHLLEEGLSDQLGAVVVDEMHMIGDHHRGYLLELLLTKILYVHHRAKDCDRESRGDTTGSQRLVQIIGMSATLPNLDILATWLRAALYRTEFRPVPLKEMVKVGSILYDTNFEQIKDYSDSSSYQGDEEDMLAICFERLVGGHSVVIFCPTKSWCEKLASNIASASFLSLQENQETSAHVELDCSALSGVCEQLRRTPAGLDPVLSKTVPSGVAFHHAGLTYDEREIIEGAFRQCYVKILVATSTLSSGVNLPARLVIIRTPIFQQTLLDIMVYKQMVGRAGRKGVDHQGESILICKSSERTKVAALLKSTPQPVRSCLGRPPPTDTRGGGGQGRRRGKTADHLLSLTRAILEVIASGTAASRRDVDAYISCTLLYAELTESFKQSHKTTEDPSSSVKLLIRDTLEFLQENEFVALRNRPTRSKSPIHPREQEEEVKEGEENDEEEYYATQLGSATMASALSPSEALVVFAELLRARRAFVLENELHLIYLVTPVYIQDQWPSIDWYRFLCLWERLPADMKHVANIIGIQESFLAQAVQGRIPERTPAQCQRLQVHRRFLTALALHDLVREVPLALVAHKYSVSKGLLQNLQSASGTFAGMVTVFCSRLGWKNLELLLSQFQSRLTFGIERELCDLVQISALNGSRARALYNAGFHTLSAIATANPITIESCLRKAFPFQSSKTDSGRGVHTAWCSKLRRGMTESEQAILIVKEAQHLLAEQLGLPETAWSSTGQKEDLPVHKVMQQGMKDMLPPPQPFPPSRTTRQVTIRINKSSCDRQLREQSNFEGQGVEQPNKCSTSSNVAMNIPRSRDVQVPAQAPGETTGDKPPRHSSLSPPLLSSPPPSQPTSKNCSHPISLSSTSDHNCDLSVSLISSQALAAIDAACAKALEEEDQGQHSQYPLYTNRDEVMEDMQVVAESPGHSQTTPYPSDGPTPPPPSPPKNISQLPFSQDHPHAQDIKEHPHAQDIMELSDLCSSTCTESGLTIVNVTANKVLFDAFLSKCLKQTSISFSVATEPIKSAGIGSFKISQRHQTKGIPLHQANEQVVGVAFCWGGNKVYYISLNEQNTAGDQEHSDMTTPPVGPQSTVAQNTGLTALRQLLTAPRQVKVTAYDLKQQAKLIMAVTGVEPFQGSVLCDPVVADWLLDPSSKSKSLHQMLLQYLPDQPLLHRGNGDNEVPLSSLATHSPSPCLRASSKCVLAFLLMEKLAVLLQSEELCNSFFLVEMPSQLALAKIELNGIGFSVDECGHLRDTLKGHLSQLEQLAYQYAGRSFSLSSPEEVAQVLFVDLQLPSGQEKQSCGVSTRRGKKRIQHLSTAKDVLLKICHLHPLPGIILEWRRVFNTISKTLYPLFKETANHEQLNSVRIHSTCQLHTATGRVSFSDPNLQIIPKEYSIGLETAASDQDSFLIELGISRDTVEQASNVRLVCMRNVFTAFPGAVFLAADYSQLELRIMAHMSGDTTLQQFLNSDGDAFRFIAGEWLGVTPSEVSDNQRQRTKQICYGMIYGIGGKALAEQLGVTEEEALGFMESFKAKYPAMQQFISSTIQLCCEKGYIVTLKGRRRYLPGIHSSDVQARSQAERQAVNSTIQGSAADLAKTAMNNIDRQLAKSSSSTFLSPECPHKPVLLVLQLHDELLYEVHESMLQEVASVVRREMECAMDLSVKLPVKLKTGRSWGSLTPYEQ